MEKDVLISVIGIQDNLDINEKEEIEMITTGKFFEKGEKIFITYKENDLLGDKTKSATSTIKIEDDRVTLSRLGDSNTHMVFEVGKKHRSYYATPFGTFDIGIMTRSMNVDIDDDKGNIDIKYLLEVNNAPVGVNDIQVKFHNNKKELKLFDN